jgi:hypothetical protein
VLIGVHEEALGQAIASAFLKDGYEVSSTTAGSALVDRLAVSLHPEYGTIRIDLVVSEARLLGPRESRRLLRLSDWASMPPVVLVVEAADVETVGWSDGLGKVVMVKQPIAMEQLRKLACNLVAANLTDWAGMSANEPI